MTVIDIAAFSGVAPSVSGRGLGANFARTNKNLFLRSGEFWPLASDLYHGEAVPGAKTLHRFQRDTNGALLQNPSAPIRTYEQELSFVKGQINDELTERTYFTYDDGSSPPRTVDVRGNDRLLGVARPAAPQLKLTVVDEFTLDEAKTWLYGDFAKSVMDALRRNHIATETCEPRNRYDEGGRILSGASEKYTLSFYDELGVPVSAALRPSHLYAVVTKQRAKDAKIDIARLGGVDIGEAYAVGFGALPATARVRWDAFSEEIRLMEFPEFAGDKAGSPVLDEAKAGKVIEAAQKALSVGSALDALRSELNAILIEASDLLVHSFVDPLGDVPVKPEPPGSPDKEWLWDGGYSDGHYKNPKWIEYEKKLAEYEKAMSKYFNGLQEENAQASSLNARAFEIQVRCNAILVDMEEVLYNAWESLARNEAIVGKWLDDLGGSSDFAGELTERVIESRYYLVALVTDWGEESEPSPLSEMLELDANDKVQVMRPLLLSGETYQERHITKWRLYRSNTSGTAAAWQLVAELGMEIHSFLDDKPSSELDSLQPQFTWAAPPYRQDGQHEGLLKPIVGDNPYLRGLRGMPNGIMAGFIDNTVAFCEPYVPYAWPYEYQTTTEFPVVGLGVFGQTLFVGTTGNPYFITGAHSASMSAVKLDSNQSCASGRSIIGVQGGVIYASPDGLCLASHAGVQCITGQLITREDWQLMNPASMFAAEHEGVVYLFYAGAGGGCLVYDAESKKMGHVELRASAVWVDRFNDLMYVANDGQVLQCFGEASKRVGVWKTGIRTMPQQGALAWVKAYGAQTEEAPAIVRLWGDGVLRHTATLTSLEPKRLPAGRWLEYEIEIESAARLDRVVLCTTTQELRSV